MHNLREKKFDLNSIVDQFCLSTYAGDGASERQHAQNSCANKEKILTVNFSLGYVSYFSKQHKILNFISVPIINYVLYSVSRNSRYCTLAEL